MIAMCTQCFKVYPSYLLVPDYDFYQIALCNDKKCRGSVCEVDDLLLPAISMLNKKGYHTSYCCSGHLYGDNGNIHFYVYFKDGCLPLDIPKMFAVDKGEDAIIRHTTNKFKGKSGLERYKQILDINLAFYEWVNKLPKKELIRLNG